MTSLSDIQIDYIKRCIDRHGLECFIDWNLDVLLSISKGDDKTYVISILKYLSAKL